MCARSTSTEEPLRLNKSKPALFFAFLLGDKPWCVISCATTTVILCWAELVGNLLSELVVHVIWQIMLAERGWSKDNLLVLDLQTGEGAVFKPKGSAKGDLDKHALWLCPLFEPFLGWLYEQDLTDIEKLPALVKIKNPASALYGYRRPGPGATQRKPAEQMPAKRAGKKSAKSH